MRPTSPQVRRGRRHGLVLGIASVVLGLLAVAYASNSAEDARATTASAPASDAVRIRFAIGEHTTLPLPDGRSAPVRSLLNISRPMRFGDYVWNEDRVPAGKTWVRVDLAAQTLSVFRAGHEIGSTIVLYGTDGKPTPSGNFPILDKATEHQSTLYEAEMPFMLRLTGDGVAIHASNVRQGSATHGCIGVPLSFARLLYSHVKRGDVVSILPAARSG